MSNRDATDTIKGYFYQFDYTISNLLELKNEDDFITIEGIEDIDINSISEDAAIQCKYYAKSDYNHSIIAKPIRLMLNHFKKVKSGTESFVQYYLYGHYKQGQEKLNLPITVDFLKQHFLTYTQKKIEYRYHDILELTDDDLLEFINKLTININALDYHTQLNNILNSLEKTFKCSTFEAEHFYYNNALKVIKELSTQNNVGDRKISKKEFLRRINNKQTLFNEWFLLFKGKKEFFRSLRNEYFSNLNTSPFERFFLIELDSTEYSRANLKELLFLISNKWSNLSRRSPTPFCPYVYLHNISDSELIEIKQELMADDFKIVDGHLFNGSPFSTKAISDSANFTNQIKLKIINTLNDLNLTINHIEKTREIYQFHKLSPSFFDIQNESIKHVKIPYEQLKDIKEII
ncbi:hypothetical protein ORM67_26125 [Bacillus cereus]|uniref:DUF4297 family anti-phage-associated protein n=1 Tax=Bacillus cereus TaxID=1396 RepID=UPI002ABF24D1|nr:DUF4297 family anti-phage-associated protein [Bacillus cereus]MDZ4654055.1 hypothetical protein [Bacillus cereus]